MNRTHLTVLMLLFVALWGWTFTGVKQAIDQFDVMGFLALRFTVAALALAGFGIFQLVRALLG